MIKRFDPIFKISSAPFLFEDEAHWFKVFDGQIGCEVLEADETIRLMGLTYYDAGIRNFYMKHGPILSRWLYPCYW